MDSGKNSLLQMMGAVGEVDGDMLFDGLDLDVDDILPAGPTGMPSTLGTALAGAPDDPPLDGEVIGLAAAPMLCNIKVAQES